jgi:hypothetical protein
MPICICSMAKHMVIQDRQGDHTASFFLKESFRLVVLLWSYICIYVRLVLTDSNTMASPILHLTPLDFNFWSHTKDLVYEVEINTKGQLQKYVTDAANQIRKNPEMLNYVYENWYQRTQMCLNANGRHTEHLLSNNVFSLVYLSLVSRYCQLELEVRICKVEINLFNTLFWLFNHN